MVSFNAACILMRRSSRSSRSGAVRGISGPLPLEALGLRAAFGVSSGVAFDRADDVLPIAGVRQQCEMLVGAVLQRWAQSVRVLHSRLLVPRN